jgi:hypothetical protein
MTTPGSTNNSSALAPETDVTSTDAGGGMAERPILAVMGMLSFFSVIGTAGNAMVLYVYVRKRNKLASTIFIITLAGTDLVTCLIIVPYTITVEYLLYFVQYDILCKLYLFFITSNVPFSAFIMVAIAVDRYFCICHPFLHLLNARRAKNSIMLLMLLATLLGIITSLNYGVYGVHTFIPPDGTDTVIGQLNHSVALETNTSTVTPPIMAALYTDDNHSAATNNSTSG